MMDARAVLVFVIGTAARLLIPIAVTAVAVYFLRKLDKRWQSEAQQVPLQVTKPACWEIKGCSPEARKKCIGYASPLPCWQARRTANGRLRAECLGCDVFAKAPVPSLG